MKRILLLLSLVMMFFIGACSTSIATAEQTHPIKIWRANNNGYYNTLLVLDEETGVNYIVASCDKGISITPRLNADGSLYVTP